MRERAIIEPHLTDVNNCTLSIEDLKVTGSLVTRLGAKSGRAPSGVLTGNIPIHSQHLNPPDHFPKMPRWKV